MVVTSYADTRHVMPEVRGLPERYAQDFRDCWEVWSDRLPRNLERRRYYEGKAEVKNIGVSIPDDLSKLPIKCGWPEKAVDALAVRSRFDGFTSDEDTSEIDAIVSDNGLKREYNNLVRSQLVYGLAFLTVTAGDEGEPGVVIRGYSAVNAACVWDYAKRRVKCGITVHDVDRTGTPTRYELYEDYVTVDVRKVGSDWTFDVTPQPMGRPLIEPLVYDGDDDYPLGHSRLSRTALEICDRMMREELRTELASELSALPSKYILGGDRKDAENFKKNVSKWSLYVDSINWITKDKDGDVPQVGQFAQPSMQPHLSYMEFLAGQFSEETDIPLEMLGVQSHTYTSTNSAQAANEPLIIAANDMNADNGAALETAARMALALKRNVPLASLDAPRMIASFIDPALPSVVSTSDAVAKMNSVIPDIGMTGVGMELLGLNEEQRIRVNSDLRRIRAAKAMAQSYAEMARTRAQTRPQAPQTPQTQPHGQSQGGETDGAV